MSRSETTCTPKKEALTRTERWKPVFLGALAESGNVTVATSEAGVSRMTAYNAKRNDPEFKQAWAEALSSAADLMEAEARRRAVDGVNEPVVYQGQLCGQWVNAEGETVNEQTPGAKLIPITIRKYSDTLLIFLMKAARPKKYRDNAKIVVQSNHGGVVRHEHSHRFDHEAFKRQFEDYARERLRGVRGSALAANGN